MVRRMLRWRGLWLVAAGGLLALGFGIRQRGGGEWQVDKAHSRIGFRIQHMGISEVSGEFKNWDMTVTMQGEDLTTAQIRLEIDAASIDTRNAKRDEHLRSCDFFCVEKYPKIIFTSTRVRKVGDRVYELEGNLTMHGQTHPVQLEVIHNGTVKDPWGNTRAGFEVRGKLDRYQWGITYGGKLETGELTIGREVELDIHIELVRGG